MIDLLVLVFMFLFFFLSVSALLLPYYRPLRKYDLSNSKTCMSASASVTVIFFFGGGGGEIKGSKGS